jgi:hypothetical protein
MKKSQSKLTHYYYIKKKNKEVRHNYHYYKGVCHNVALPFT